IYAVLLFESLEQCLVAGCRERRCPKCDVSRKQLGDPLHSILRDPDKSIDAFQKAARGDSKASEKLGLCNINPFWKNLPLCNIFHCFTPNILHQLHKGVFKDHIVKWSIEAILGNLKDSEKEINTRFQSMLQHHTLRHFKKGISLVSQWTRNEYRNMEKVFLGVLAGTATSDVVICMCAVLDFIQYAHFDLHMDDSLEKMNAALKTFHDHKEAAFVEPGIREHFNIPKVHSMNHYTPMIRSHGSATNFNSEWSECLHIDFAKLAYRASSKKGYLKQMTKWLDWREKVLWFTRFLDWMLAGDGLDWLQKPTMDEEGDDEEEEDEIESTQTNSDSEELLYGESTCLVAKHPPHSNINLATLDSEYGCSTFVYAMERFLKDHDLLKPDYWDAAPAKYDLYKLVHITIPPMPEILGSPATDIIHATAAQAAKQWKYCPAQFDTVLAWKELPKGHSIPLDGLGPNGLHVARVRAIFNLPAELGTFPHPLAYVDWFTPLRKVDKDTLMYRVEHSERNHIRVSSIIPVTYISRSCHLVPFSGKCTNRSWTSESILDKCKSFLLNPYLRPVDFVHLRHRNEPIL
ncbi:hypothetical protein BT96DRAFT_1074145, partial [Gymnopus androsaceus JB14]